jgi:hypothetical protein
LVFGLALGGVLGVILAVPLSAAATIVKDAPSPVEVNAPQSITFESDVLTRRAQDKAANDPANVQPIIDTTRPARQRERMLDTFEQITRVRKNDTLSPAERSTEIGSISELPLSSDQVQQLVELSDERWQLVEMKRGGCTTRFGKAVLAG